MSKWKYDGYTKVKVGSGRHQRYVENHIYICGVCGKTIRIERTVKPPMICPHCLSNMKEEDGGK